MYFWRAASTSLEVMQFRFSLALINKRRARVGDKYRSHAPSRKSVAPVGLEVRVRLGDRDLRHTYTLRLITARKMKREEKKIRRLTTIPTVSLAWTSAEGKRLRTRVRIYIWRVHTRVLRDVGRCFLAKVFVPLSFSLHPFAPRSTSFSFSLLPVSFSSILHRNPGYTLAAAAPRSVLRVQGGANLQRVGASRRSQVRCHCLATVAHWEKRESAEKEEEAEGEVRATELSRSVGCSATMSSLIVPSTSNQRQRCIVAVRLTNRTTRLSHPPASCPFLPSYRFAPANNARPQRDWYRMIRITDRFRPRRGLYRATGHRVR